MGAFSFDTSCATRDDDGYAAMADAGGNEPAVGDNAGQHDTPAAGASNSDGSVSVGIDHVSHERENGDERDATGVSAGYKLASGVDWKSPIIGTKDDTRNTEGTVS